MLTLPPRHRSCQWCTSQGTSNVLNSSQCDFNMFLDIETLLEHQISMNPQNLSRDKDSKAKFLNAKRLNQSSMAISSGAIVLEREALRQFQGARSFHLADMGKSAGNDS